MHQIPHIIFRHFCLVKCQPCRVILNLTHRKRSTFLKIWRLCRFCSFIRIRQCLIYIKCPCLRNPFVRKKVIIFNGHPASACLNYKPLCNLACIWRNRTIDHTGLHFHIRERNRVNRGITAILPDTGRHIVRTVYMPGKCDRMRM